MDRFKNLQFILVSVILTVLILVFSPVSVFAQDYHVAWNDNFGGAGDDSFNAVTVAAQRADGFVAVGYSEESSFINGNWEGVAGKGGMDAIIVSYGTDIQSEILWSENFGGKGNDNFWGVTTIADGYIAVGQSSVASFGTGDWEDVAGKGGDDAIIVKYDQSGNVVWKKNFGGNGNDFYDAVTIVTDGIVVVGSSYPESFDNGDWTGVSGKGWVDAIIVKYDYDGNVVWKKNFGGSNYDRYTWVAAASDGMVAVGLSYSDSFGTGDWEGVTGKGDFDAIIVKYDNDGNVIWKKNFGGSGQDNFISVTAVSDGYVVAGESWETSFGTGDWTNASGNGDWDAVIVKYDHDGNVVWKKNFGGSSIDIFSAITKVPDGYVAVGSSYIYNNDGDWTGIMGKGGRDATMVKYDTAGNLVWKKNFGGSGYDDFIWVCEVYGGFIAMGNSGPDYISGEDSFGTGDWTGVVGKGGQDATIVKCGTLIITFIPVTEIINLPITAVVGTPLNLKGTIVPGNATYQTFAWSVLDAGTTGVTISGSTFNATGTGIVVIRATIANGSGEGEDYWQDFSITVNPEGFVSVINITDIPTSTTVGIPLTLTARVVPINATNQTIVWSIKSAGNTGATLSGNILNTTATGTVIIEATITDGIGTDIDYVKECVIAVNPAGFVPVTDIINVPQWTTVGVPLTLTGTVVPSNATYKTIVWSVHNAGITGATISNGNILNANKVGTATIRATIENGIGIGIAYIKDFKIGINPEDFVPVTDIIDVPTETTVKIPLILIGTVVPENATCQTIKWAISNAGGTGATISDGNIFNSTKAGTVIVRATIAGGSGIGIEYTQDFNITVKGIVNIPEISQLNPLKAYSQNRILYVSGLTVGETWRVYDILGEIVYQGIATDETANTPLQVSGVYIIRAGDKTGKVVAR